MHHPLRGVVIGAGYFSHYHLDGWARIPEVGIVAIANRTVEKAHTKQAEFHIPRCYGDYREMIDREQPDFVDIVTAPSTHREICLYAAERGIHVICQKPLAPSYNESREIVEAMNRYSTRFMVHENWRWQPWYREIKRLLVAGALGEPFSLYFRMRMGDGWGEDAYLARQPFFRDYPRLLMFETGGHFLDTFRFLFGEIETVYARLRRLNPVIQGEDSGQILLGCQGKVSVIFDASRYNEAETEDTRYTFGELRLDGSKGHLRMDTGGNLTIKLLGQPPVPHPYPHENRGFAGDCCYAAERHFVDCLLSGEPFESEGDDYLRTLQAVEACYASHERGKVIHLLG